MGGVKFILKIGSRSVQQSLSFNNSPYAKIESAKQINKFIKNIDRRYGTVYPKPAALSAEVFFSLSDNSTFPAAQTK